ncbi:MAG: hypothetical protein PHS41_13465, partial [Victivallaceae bacterium]|nr:hypothetical protein [Victivallaceae bacterium]
MFNFRTFSLSFAAFLTAATVFAAVPMRVHRGAEYGLTLSPVGTGENGKISAMQLQWEKASVGYAEIVFTPALPCPADAGTKIVVKLAEPENIEFRGIRLRISDAKKEIFQYRPESVDLKSGLVVFAPSAQTLHSFWGKDSNGTWDGKCVVSSLILGVSHRDKSGKVQISMPQIKIPGTPTANGEASRRDEVYHFDRMELWHAAGNKGNLIALREAADGGLTVESAKAGDFLLREKKSRMRCTGRVETWILELKTLAGEGRVGLEILPEGGTAPVRIAAMALPRGGGGKLIFSVPESFQGKEQYPPALFFSSPHGALKVQLRKLTAIRRCSIP